MGENSKLSLSKSNDYFENATLHGISKIYNAKRPFREFFWIFIFISSLCYFGFLLQSRITEYFKLKIKVTTIYEEEFGGMSFPAVTVCNANKISLKKFIQTFRVPKKDAYNIGRCYKILNDVSKMPLETLYNLSTVKFSMVGPYFEFNDLLFAPIEKNLKTTVIVGHGTCFTFNHDGKGKQTKPGSDMGLKMYLDVDVDDYLPCDFLLNEKSTGVKLYVHEPNSEFDMSSPITAPPGYVTSMNVKRSEIERLQTPYIDDCRMDSDSERDEFPIITSTKYSVQACQKNFFIFKLNKTCGMIDISSFVHMLDNFKDDFKVITDFYECMDNFHIRFSKGLVECKCRKPCHETNFLPSSNMATWPPKMSMNAWIKQVSAVKNQSVDEQYIKENIVALEIFYQEFRTLKTVHSPAYTGDTLAADMAGLSGLFIGASVFSIFELLAFLATLIYNNIYSKMKNNPKAKHVEG